MQAAEFLETAPPRRAHCLDLEVAALAWELEFGGKKRRRKTGGKNP
jgi:hypothetical protein